MIKYGTWLSDWDLYSVSTGLKYKYWTSKNNNEELDNYSELLVTKKFIREFIEIV